MSPSLTWRWVAWTSSCGIAALANLPGVRAVVQHALSDDTASHTLIIPAMTLGLLVNDRRAVFASVRWAPAGAVLAALGVLAGALWRAGMLPSDGGLFLVWPAAALVTVWIGAFVTCFGPAAFRAARFPLLFLVLAIPLPAPVLDGIVALLKSGSADAVAVLFALTGTPYHRTGFVFELSTVAIEIADECSGIRSSLALGVMGLLIGHLSLDATWKRVVLLVAVLPIAILKNAVRIGALSLLAVHVDPAFLAGQLHHDGGVVFFAISLALLGSLVPVLRRTDGIVARLRTARFAFSR